MFSLIKNIKAVNRLSEIIAPKIIITKQCVAYSSGVNSNKEILTENKSGVCVITVNRPQKYNAFTTQMFEDFTAALNTASKDGSIKLTFITGIGDYFTSGNDLNNFQNAYKQFNGDINAGSEAFGQTVQQFITAFIDFQKPLIGAVNGPAVGIGATMLGLMDCVICTDSSTFQTPFTALGLTPEGCSSYTFPLIMGYSRANEMLCFNLKMSAKEALDCGLVSRIVPKDQFKTHIENWIFGANGLINSCYPQSMQLSKALVRNKEIREKLHKTNKEESNALKERFVSQDFLQELQKFFNRKQKK